MKQTLIFAVVGALLCSVAPAKAGTIVRVDPDATWLGFVNVSALPENGGAYVFGSAWGLDALVALFDNPAATLTLAPTVVNDTSSFWYQGEGTNPGGPGVPGNKNVDANLYVETTDALGGQTVTFKGSVLSNSLVSPYTSVAFIKDFAPDYSSFTISTVPLTPGAFSVSHATDPGAGRHVQYGFETIGPNLWPSDVTTKGLVVIRTVPEPSSVLLAGLAVLAGVGAIRLQRPAR